MTIFELLSSARKALAVAGVVDGFAGDLGLAKRAAVNALVATGFPLGPAYCAWQRHSGDPAALVHALRSSSEVRRWVLEWSEGTGKVRKPRRRR